MVAIDAPSKTVPADRTSHLRAPPSLVVGREREHAQLLDLLEEAATGLGRVVLLGGEAGMGKTTLARLLTADANARDVRILAAHCYDRTNAPPYGLWLEWFDRDHRESSLPEPPLPLTGGRLARIADQGSLFLDVRRYFSELVAGGPVFVLLEDVHWADPASVDLLRYLAVYVNHWPILMVATYRFDEPPAHQPFYQQLPAIVREAEGIRIDLAPLNPADLGDLVNGRYRLSPPDASRLVAYLDRHADGNPLFAVELLRALEGNGLLRAGDERSFLGSLDRVVVPSLIQQVIDSRVVRLGDEMRQPLAIAAAIGQEVSIALWAEVAEIGEETLLNIIERAVAANLLDVDRDGKRVHFVHALTREAVYESTLAPRRNMWHRRIAETLAAGPNPDIDSVALHFQQSGDPRAAEWLQRAGDQAQRAYAWNTAADRTRAAAKFLLDRAGTERTYMSLMFRVGYLLRFSDTAGSLEAIDEVQLFGQRLQDWILVADVRHIRGIHLCYADRFRDGLAEMRAGVRALETLPIDAERAVTAMRHWFPQDIAEAIGGDLSEDEAVVRRLHAAGFDIRRCTLLWFGALAERPAEIVATGERYVALVASEPNARGAVRFSLAFAFHALGIAYAALGQATRAREAWERSRRLFVEIEHHTLIAFTYLNQTQQLALTVAADDPAQRRLLASEATLAVGRAGGALRPGLSPRLAEIACLFLDGRWTEIDAILRDLTDPGNSMLRRAITTTAATLAFERGDDDRARLMIAGVLPHGPATEPGDAMRDEALQLQRLAATIGLAAGDLATAKTWLEAHDRWLAWSGAVLGRADGHLLWACWHQLAGDRARAKLVATEALALATTPAQPLVTLAAHRLLGELASGEGAFDVAEEHFAAALELAGACETPFEQAQTLVALAGARLASGTGEVEMVIAKARAIAERLNANRLLARLQGIAPPTDPHAAEPHPAGLTPRELDVLHLLVEHHTDKEIADALFISPYTASTHVKHLLAKLGAANRREAAARANELGLN